MSGWGSDPWHGHHQHLHHLTLACRAWRAHRLLCDDTLERDGLHGGLLLRSGSGRHFELTDVTSIRFCAVGVWRGGYRLQAYQRGRKECWRGEDDDLASTGKRRAIYSSSAIAVPPSYLSARGMVERGSRRRDRPGEGKFGKASGLDIGQKPSDAARVLRSVGTSWLFSHVRRDGMPALPTGREGGECIEQAASAYH